MIFIKFGITYKNLFRKDELCENRWSVSHTFLMGVYKFLSVIYTFLGRFMRNLAQATLHTIPVSKDKFRETRHSETHTILRGMLKRLRWSRGSVLAFGTQVRVFKPRLPSEGK